MTTHRLGRRVAAACLLAAGLVLAGAAQASAHVSVEGADARPGASDAVLSFRVPNERAGATTVSVAITFPTRTPLASVKPAPKAGWTVATTRITFPQPIVTDDGQLTEGVGKVTYTATSPAAGIPEGGFDTFQLLVGPIPRGVTALAFPTVQTYSNGDVSSWIEPSAPGSEPAHPAPVLELAAAPSGASPEAGAAGRGGDGASRGDVRSARLLALVGVVTGSLGLLAAGYAVGQARRRPDVS